MLATTCFTRDELELYLLGRADDELSTAIEGHLDQCTRCDDTLSDLDEGDDTLVRTLQVKRPRTQSPPDWVTRIASQPFMDGGSAAAQEAASSTAPVELGDYELTSVLGRGGMSVVFAARHKHLGREVALKVLLPTTQQRSVSRDRFVREMRAVGGLDHPAIIRATDAGECNETLYLVMERIAGVDLNRVSKAEGPLRVADACAIGIEAARGLAHAHQQGIVHRDIKPSNLMLDHNGQIKILDFGLARMQSAACDVSLQTTMGQLLGTLDYMAPEQANGCDVDPRADIYALGATLFKLLTGAPPHGRSSEMPVIEFLHRLATDEAARLDDHRDQLPGELVELIAGMLQRDPAQRADSADEVVARLQPFAAGSQLLDLANKATARRTELQDQESGSIQPELSELWSPPVPPDNASPQSQSPKPLPLPPQRRNGWLGWAMVAFSGLLLLGTVALTIVLTLKTPEGEIRIESELENIRVELVDEQNRVDVIAVEQGEATTTVRAGRYRIRLNSPADGIEISPREILVTKNKMTIAKVTRIPAPPAAAAAGATQPATQPAPQRHPLIAMEAQVKLAKTMDELANAKRQEKPNERVIQSLEDKLSRLRALSRPIPTEPVYEGRTLADWVAQMRFEQESVARKIAASNVLKLADTLPEEEKIKLLIEAGSRLYAWDKRSLEGRLYSEVRGGRESIGSSAQRIGEADRRLAAVQVIEALRSEDRDRREYALTLCADLRDQLREDAWPGVLAALAARCRADQGADRVASQLTHAICVPDASQASEALLSIDVDDASELALISMIFAAVERKLKIPRAREIDWLAAYLDELRSFRTQRPPNEMVELMIQPTAGPFRNVDWNDVDPELQPDINAVVGRLLATLELRLNQVADNPRDTERQLETATTSNILTRIISEVDLTGATRLRAIKLLERRLDQLIKFRGSSSNPPDSQTDTPASVAVAVTLLTGNAPSAIMELRLNEGSFLAEQLAAARNVLATSADYRAIRMTSSGSYGGRSYAINLSDWYPFELLTALEAADRRLAAEGQSHAQFGGGGGMRGTFFGYVQSKNYGRIDTRLMLSFAKNSAAAAAFVGRMIPPGEFARDMRRHPVFLQAVNDLMKQANSLEALDVSYRLKYGGADDIVTLLSWLKSGDATHARFALARLDASNDKNLYLDWAPLAAGAIDRIAESQTLTLPELQLLDSLGSSAPQAAAHAVNFLRYWLNNPDQRPHIGGLGRKTSALRPAISILIGHPEKAREIKDEIENALADPNTSITTITDITALKQLLAKLPK